MVVIKGKERKLKNAKKIATAHLSLAARKKLNQPRDVQPVPAVAV
jgi:hypothetical protein